MTFADCCSAFAGTRPASLPETRSWHRGADRLLAVTRPALVPLLIGLGWLASLTSEALSGGRAMLPFAAYFGLAGGWCLLNLARSREAHCLVTGIGWTGLAFLSLAAALGGIDAVSAAWLAFVAVLGLGICFEVMWAARAGSTAFRRG